MIFLKPIHWIKRYFLGDDVFISYSRQDATDYAFELSRRLHKKQVTAFIDQHETYADSKTPASVLNKIKTASSFVLVASKGAQRSKAIEEELKLFLPTKRNIILVDVEGALNEANWEELTRGLPIKEEQLMHLDSADPSEGVVGRITNSLGYLKRRNRVRKGVLLSLIFIVMLIGLGTLYGFNLRGEIEKSTETINNQKSELNGQQSTLFALAQDIEYAQDSLEGANKLLKSRELELTEASTKLEEKQFELNRAEVSVREASIRLAGMNASTYSIQYNKQDEMLQNCSVLLESGGSKSEEIQMIAWKGILDANRKLTEREKLKFKNIGTISNPGFVDMTASGKLNDRFLENRMNSHLSSNEKHLTIFDSKGAVAIHNLETYEVVYNDLLASGRFYPDVTSTSDFVIFSHSMSDPRSFYNSSLESDSTIHVYSLKENKFIAYKTACATPKVKAISSDEIIYGNDVNGLYLLNLVSGNETQLLNPPVKFTYLQKFEVSPNGKFLATFEYKVTPARENLEKPYDYYVNLISLENLDTLLTRKVENRNSQRHISLSFSEDSQFFGFLNMNEVVVNSLASNTELRIPVPGKVSTLNPFFDEMKFVKSKFSNINGIYTKVSGTHTVLDLDLLFGMSENEKRDNLDTAICFKYEGDTLTNNDMMYMGGDGSAFWFNNNSGAIKQSAATNKLDGRYESESTSISKGQNLIDIVNHARKGSGQAITVENNGTLWNNKVGSTNDLMFEEIWNPVVDLPYLGKDVSLQSDVKKGVHFVPSTNSYQLFDFRDSTSRRLKLTGSRFDSGSDFEYEIQPGQGQYFWVGNARNMVGSMFHVFRENDIALPWLSFGDTIQYIRFQGNNKLLLIKQVDNEPLQFYTVNLSTKAIDEVNSQFIDDFMGERTFKGPFTEGLYTKNDLVFLTLEYDGEYSVQLFSLSEGKHIKELYKGNQNPELRFNSRGDRLGIAYGNTLNLHKVKSKSIVSYKKYFLQGLDASYRETFKFQFLNDGNIMMVTKERVDLWNPISDVSIGPVPTSAYGIKALRRLPNGKYIICTIGRNHVGEVSLRASLKKICKDISELNGYETEKCNCATFYPELNIPCK